MQVTFTRETTIGATTYEAGETADLPYHQITGYIVNGAAKVGGALPQGAPSGALSTTFGRVGTPQLIRKARAGLPVTIADDGDSILHGSTVTADGGVNGADDTMSLLAADLTDTYGITVTKSNFAASGATAAQGLISGAFNNVLTARPDCIVIGYGHNDLRSDKSSPSSGYPKAAMVASIEHRIRRARIEQPQADIIVLLENPYAAGSSSNAYLEAQNELLWALAAYYGVAVADAYTAFVERPGGYADLMADSGHPNSAGHRVIADTILALMPDVGNDPVGVPPALPVTPLHDAAKWYTPAGWQRITAASSVARTNRYVLSGSGWSSLAGAPHTSSNPGDLVRIQANGSEALLRLDTGPGHGVVSIEVDTEVLHAAFDLTTESAGQRSIPLTGLRPGPHRIIVTVVSGSVTFRGVDVLVAPTAPIPANSPRLTYTGTWTQATNDGYGFTGTRALSSTLGNSVTAEFVGTGLLLQMGRYSTDHQVEVSVDGGTYAVVDITQPGAITHSTGLATVASGLSYGHHTVTVRSVGSRSSTLLYGVVPLDERRQERPLRQAGVGIVGEALAYPASFSGRPALSLTPADATSAVPPYVTTPTPSGFTPAGTANAKVAYAAEGSRVAW